MTNLKKIPEELKEYPQWVCWKAKATENGKTTKIPYNPKTGTPASVSNPDTWASYSEAVTAFKNGGGYAGIGFVFTQGDPFFGVDLDGCVRDGEISGKALDIIICLNSYCEYSPSGKGIHVIGMGKLPLSGRKKDTVEMYDQGRFLTVTGNHLENASFEIRDCTVEITKLMAS